MLFLPGWLGKLMKDIPLVVIPALFFSLIESKFILPYHLTLCRFDKKHKNWLAKLQGKVSSGLENFIKHSYQPFLALCLRNRYLTLSAFLGLFAITLGLIFWWTRSFHQGNTNSFHSDYISVKVFMQDGVPASSTEKALEQIERAKVGGGRLFEQRGGAKSFQARYGHHGSSAFHRGAQEFLQYCDGIQHGGNQRRIDQVRRQEKPDCASSNFRSYGGKESALFPVSSNCILAPLQPEEARNGHWRRNKWARSQPDDYEPPRRSRSDWGLTKDCSTFSDTDAEEKGNLNLSSNRKGGPWA